jgi:hypothetical protein
MIYDNDNTATAVELWCDTCLLSSYEGRSGVICRGINSFVNIPVHTPALDPAPACLSSAHNVSANACVVAPRRVS